MTDASTRRPFGMFSALKFVAAAVIVALFGGFLLAGVLTTQQGDEMAPGAVTESPSATTNDDILPGVTLSVEEVEPGVFRVIDDGVRDLSFSDDGYNAPVIAGDDGSVWLIVGPEVFRLGDERTYPLTEDDGTDIPTDDWGFIYRPNPVDTLVAPDSTVWTRTGTFVYGFGHGLYAFDGQTWTVTRPDTHLDAVAMGSDGHIWAVWEGRHVGRVDEEWEVVADTPDGYITSRRDDEGRYDAAAGGLTVTDDGSIWLWPQDTGFWGWTNPTDVYRHDGETWQSVDLPGGDQGHVVVGQDGTVWWLHEKKQGVVALHRYDGDEWQRSDAADDWPQAVLEGGGRRLEVTPDGRLWVLPSRSNFHGAAFFDGDGWTPYLEGVAVVGGDVASDGSMWLLGLSEADFEGGADLYVITPEAVPATG